MRNIFLVTIILSIYGCATLQRVEPHAISGKKAYVDVSIPKMKSTGSFLMPEFRRAKVDVLNGKNGCPWDSSEKMKSSYLYTASFNKNSSQYRVEIPADNDVYFAISDILSGSGCDQSVKFTPRSEGVYQLDVTAHNSAISRCSAILKVCDESSCDSEPSANNNSIEKSGGA